MKSLYLKPESVWAADLWEGQQCSPSEFRLYKVDCHKIQLAVMRLK